MAHVRQRRNSKTRLSRLPEERGALGLGQKTLWRNGGGQKRQLRRETPPLSGSPPVPLPFTFRDLNFQDKYQMTVNQSDADGMPLEIKLVNLSTLSQLQNMEPKQMFWVRTQGFIGKTTPWTGREHSPGV